MTDGSKGKSQSALRTKKLRKPGEKSASWEPGISVAGRIFVLLNERTQNHYQSGENHFLRELTSPEQTQRFFVVNVLFCDDDVSYGIGNGWNGARENVEGKNGMFSLFTDIWLGLFMEKF